MHPVICLPVILGINLRRLRGDGVSRRCFSLRLLDLNGNADWLLRNCQGTQFQNDHCPCCNSVIYMAAFFKCGTGGGRHQMLWIS